MSEPFPLLFYNYKLRCKTIRICVWRNKIYNKPGCTSLHNPKLLLSWTFLYFIQYLIFLSWSVRHILTEWYFAIPSHRSFLCWTRGVLEVVAQIGKIPLKEQPWGFVPNLTLIFWTIHHSLNVIKALVPAEEKQPYSVMVPPPRLTVRMVLSWWCTVFLVPKIFW